jgi:hypothetical protein
MKFCLSRVLLLSIIVALTTTTTAAADMITPNVDELAVHRENTRAAVAKMMAAREAEKGETVLEVEEKGDKVEAVVAKKEEEKVVDVEVGTNDGDNDNNETNMKEEEALPPSPPQSSVTPVLKPKSKFMAGLLPKKCFPFLQSCLLKPKEYLQSLKARDPKTITKTLGVATVAFGGPAFYRRHQRVQEDVEWG